MDQGPLVREKIDAGAKFLAEFEKRVSVQAAFWLKDDELGRWNLYVALQGVDDPPLMAAYGNLGEAARNVDDPNFDMFEVKLIGADNPLTRAALEVYQGRPSKFALHFSNRYFGGMSVGGGYIYPSPITAS